METGTFFNNKLEKEKFLSLFELSEIPDEIKDLFWDIYYKYEGTTDPDKRREAEIRMNGLLARLNKAQKKEVENACRSIIERYEQSMDQYPALGSIDYMKQYIQVLSDLQDNKSHPQKPFDYRKDDNSEHLKWYVSVLSSKYSKDEGDMGLYNCLSHLYDYCLSKVLIDNTTDRDLFVYRFSGLLKPNKSFPPNDKIKWNGSNVLLGYFVRCLISDNSNPPTGMKFFADFFESSTGKRMNLATATYEEGKDFDKKRGSLRESFEKAVDILRECGFINVEFTSKRSN